LVSKSVISNKLSLLKTPVLHFSPPVVEHEHEHEHEDEDEVAAD